MKTRYFALVGALGLGLAAWIVPQVLAQPLYDTVHVNLPYTVTVGDKTLPPGDYTIQQLRSENAREMLIYGGDHGMKFETSVASIPAMADATEPPDQTTVQLRHVGDDYYLDKIFVQGKLYGYEFPLPAGVKDREREQASDTAAVTIPAQAGTTSATDNDSSTQPQQPVADTNEPATPSGDDSTPAMTTPDNSSAEPQPYDSNPAAEPQANPDTSQQPQTTTPDTSQQPSTTTDDSANREKRPASDNMPATSAGWLAMLLSGGTLSGAGMLLRRKR